MTINFFLNKSSTGKFLIMARIQKGPEKKSKYTGHVIEDKNLWKNKSVSRGYPNINDDLLKWRRRFLEYSTTLITHTVDGAIDYTFGNTKLTNYTLCDAIQQYIDGKKLFLADNTIIKYETLKRFISQYEKDKKTELMLGNLPPTFIESIATYSIEKCQNVNGTTKRRIKFILAVLRYAVDLKLISALPAFNKVNLKKSESTRYPIFLNELQLLKDYTTTSLAQRYSLDAFLFACETGIRHSDVIKLQPHNIKVIGTPDGNIHYVDFSSKKTGTQNAVVITPFALSIIEKYIQPEGNIFQLPTSQKTNDILKRIFKSAGLDRECEIIETRGNEQKVFLKKLHQLAHFHMSRNTAATNQLAAGVPITDVQENLGHADIKTTMGYNRTNFLQRAITTSKIMGK